MTYDGVAISKLTNFMKRIPSGEIVPEFYDDLAIYDALRGLVDRESFRGEYIEVLVQTSRGANARAHYENADMPKGKAPAFVKTLIPICETIAVAGITRQAMTRAVGGDTSWGNIADIAIRDMMSDFHNLMELSAVGNGTGFLGRIASATFDADHYDVVLDNTYYDSGVETTQLMRIGQMIEILDSDAATLKTTDAGALEWAVTSVSYTPRNNKATITDGTFAFDCDSDMTAAIADGDFVLIAGSHEAGAANGLASWALPMGITGIFQNATAYTNDITRVGTFQNATRSARPCLITKMYSALDFGTVKTPGAPDDWDISTITDAARQVKTDTGGVINTAFCHSKLGMAMSRKTRIESGMSVTVSSVSEMSQMITSGRMVRKIETTDGEIINVYPCDKIPPNMLFLCCKEDLRWHPLGNYDYLRLNGREWDKSYDDRKTNFEAPYGGYHNFSARRTDRAAVLFDLRTDV